MRKRAKDVIAMEILTYVMYIITGIMIGAALVRYFS